MRKQAYFGRTSEYEPDPQQVARDEAGRFYCEADAILQGIVKVLNKEEASYPIYSQPAKEEFGHEGESAALITAENVHDFIDFTIENYPIFQLIKHYSEQIECPILLTGTLADTIPVIN